MADPITGSGPIEAGETEVVLAVTSEEDVTIESELGADLGERPEVVPEDTEDATEAQDVSDDVPDVPEGGVPEGDVAQDEGSGADDDAHAPRMVPVTVLAIACVVALLVGVALSGAFRSDTGGSSSGVESHLSRDVTAAVSQEDAGEVVMMHVSWNGHERDLTVADVLSSVGTFASVEGTGVDVRLPSAETAISAARSVVLVWAAEDEGIACADEDVDAYVDERLGLSSVSEAARLYNMSEAELREMVRGQLLRDKLQDSRQEAADDGADESAEPAPMPSEDNGKMSAKKWRAYVKELAGDAWSDGKPVAGSWVAEALGDANPGTRKGAQLVHDAAMERWSTSARGSTVAWQEWVDGVMSRASVTLSGIVS